MTINPMPWLRARLFKWLLANEHAQLIRRVNAAETAANKAANARRDEANAMNTVMRYSVTVEKLAQEAKTDVAQLRLALQTDIQEREQALGNAERFSNVVNRLNKVEDNTNTAMQLNARAAETAKAATELSGQTMNSLSAMRGWLVKDIDQTRRIEILEKWADCIETCPAIASDAVSRATLAEQLRAEWLKADEAEHARAAQARREWEQRNADRPETDRADAGQRQEDASPRSSQYPDALRGLDGGGPANPD